VITMTIPTIEPLEHAEAMQLQAQELDQTIAMLSTLDETDWTTRTDCPDWDVRQMYLHVLGACEGGASMFENVGQMRAAFSYRKKFGGPLEAALSAVQIQKREELSPGEIVAKLETTAPKTVRGRKRTPSIMRNHAKMAIDGPVHESWTIGYLIDTIYLRDMWMHRVDATRVTGKPIELSQDHDGRIVADVVAEWARRHGRPFTLELEGPAGGTFAQDTDSPETEHITLDAVEFCRILAGRDKENATGLMATIVPF
jgi:uncharacterized protein (TIGR03083 family)